MSFDLCDKERKSAVVKTLIYIFHRLQNKPSTADILAKHYISVKGGIHQRQSNAQDRCTGVRTFMSVWNKIAKEYNLGQHSPGLDGCKEMGYHRICKCKTKDTKNTVYWINKNLAENIFKNPIEIAKRTKQVKNSVVIVDYDGKKTPTDNNIQKFSSTKEFIYEPMNSSSSNNIHKKDEETVEEETVEEEYDENDNIPSHVSNWSNDYFDNNYQHQNYQYHYHNEQQQQIYDEHNKLTSLLQVVNNEFEETFGSL